MPSISAIVRALATFDATGVIANAETVTVCGKVYTFETSLTDVDGNVKLGADDDATIDNLVAAINLAAGSGTTYAASMTVNLHCSAVADGASPNVATFTAKVPGVIGNFLTLAEATTGGVISGAVFTTGAGHVYTAIDEIIDKGQVNSDVISTLDKLNATAGADK